MEYTLSGDEKDRVPDPSEAEMIGILTTGAFSVYMGAPIAVDDDRIVTSVDWADGSLTVAAQPDVPRNLTAVLTDADDSITGGTLTITGQDVAGNTITEVFTRTALLKTWTGTKVFAKVTSVVIASTAGTPAAGTDVVKVGVGNVIGTPFPLGVSSEVVHVFLAAVRITTLDAVATGVSTSGIDINSATYDGTKHMWAIIKPAKNT